MSKKLSLATLAATLVTFFASTALAADGAASNESDVKVAAAIAAGFAIGVAALGGTLAQGRAVAAALEGISRNPGAQPKIQTPMILGLALIESLVLLGFVIAFQLLGKA